MPPAEARPPEQERTRAGIEVVVAPIRSGTTGGPVVVVTPAWVDPRVYYDMAEALPDDVVVLAVEVCESTGVPDGPLHCVDPVVEEAVALLTPILENRRSAVVGYSVGGILAHEIRRRLDERSVPVEFVGLIDTWFPGRAERMWARRVAKYRGLWSSRALGETAVELRRAVGRRLWRLVATGSRAMVEPIRINDSQVPTRVLAYTPSPSRVPHLLYVATDTVASGCEDPWRKLEPSLQVVRCGGTHTGQQRMILSPWVDEVAGDIGRRLLDADHGSTACGGN